MVEKSDRARFVGAPVNKGRAKGWPSLLLNATESGVAREEIKGGLTVFTNKRGTSRVGVGKKQLEINEDLINHF